LEALQVWLEGSALGQTMRTSGVWTYGVVNLAHIVGIATLFGSVLVLDLRLLGVWRQVPLVLLEKPTVPLAVVGFALAAASGVCLITANATEYLGNPFIPIKFGAIAFGLVNVAVLQILPAWKVRAARALTPREHLQLALAGGVSLASWLAAVAAGRMIGYW
jgi:hypothetical protein